MTNDSELRIVLSNFKQMEIVDREALSGALKIKADSDPSLKARIIRIVREIVAHSDSLKMVDFIILFSNVCGCREAHTLMFEVPVLTAEDPDPASEIYDRTSVLTEGNEPISEAIDPKSSSEAPPITDPAFLQKEREVSSGQKPKRRKRIAIKIMLICILFLSLALFLNKPEPQQEQISAVATTNEAKKPTEPERPGGMANCKLFVEPDPKDSLVRVLNTSEKFHQGMALEPGRYRLKISHKGYETAVRDIVLESGQTEIVTVRLEIKKCKLFVEPDPKDSLVRVLNISEKFHQGMMLMPGRYHLEISHNGYETEKKWVELKAGESRKTIRIHLEASPVDYGRYLVYPSGVIWDSNTGLEWLIGPDKAITFPEAEKWLTTENVGIQGTREWRIPTVKELSTLYNKWKGTKRNIPKIFKMTGWYAWARKATDSSEILLYSFYNGQRTNPSHVSISFVRVFAVRSHGD